MGELLRSRRYQPVRLALAVATPLLLVGCENTASIDTGHLTYRNQTFDDVNLSDAQQKLLRPSATFWLGATETIGLSWEAVATVFSNNQQFHVGACRNENADTGGSDIGGLTPIPTQSWPSFFPGRFLACDPANFAIATCQPVPNVCDGTPPASFPYCAQDCAVHPKRDTIYMVLPERVAPLLIRPNFAVVTNLRIISRRMTFDTARNTFLFNVPTLPDGRFEDEFSRNLFVSRLRAQSGFSGLYLPLVGFRAEGGGATLGGCTPDPGDNTQITLPHCGVLGGVVPSSAQWKLDVAAPDGSPGRPGNVGEVWLEFTLAEKGSEAAGPLLAPAQVELGAASVGNNIARAGVIGVAADKSGPWTVNTLTVTGATASDWTASIHGMPSTPFSFPAFGGFSIDLAVSGANAGDKADSLTVQLSGPGGQTKTLTAAIHAQIWPTAAELLPYQRNFGAAFGTAPLPWRGTMVVTNDQPWPMRVNSIAPTGPGAGAFRVVTQNGQSTLSLPQTVESGSVLYFAVQYCPSSAGNFDAALQAQVDVSSDPSHPNPVTLTSQLHGVAPPNTVTLCPP